MESLKNAPNWIKASAVVGAVGIIGYCIYTNRIKLGIVGSSRGSKNVETKAERIDDGTGTSDQCDDETEPGRVTEGSPVVRSDSEYSREFPALPSSADEGKKNGLRTFLIGQPKKQASKEGKSKKR